MLFCCDLDPRAFGVCSCVWCEVWVWLYLPQFGVCSCVWREVWVCCIFPSLECVLVFGVRCGSGCIFPSLECALVFGVRCGSGCISPSLECALVFGVRCGSGCVSPSGLAAVPVLCTDKSVFAPVTGAGGVYPTLVLVNIRLSSCPVFLLFPSRSGLVVPMWQGLSPH